MNRVEDILEKLDKGSVSRDEAAALYQEATDHLQEVREILDGDEGVVRELE